QPPRHDSGPLLGSDVGRGGGGRDGTRRPRSGGGVGADSCRRAGVAALAAGGPARGGSVRPRPAARRGRRKADLSGGGGGGGRRGGHTQPRGAERSGRG